MCCFFQFWFCLFLSAEDNRVAELETKLEEVKTLRDLEEQEKSEQSIKCEALETQTMEVKTKLQSSELEVNKR